MGRCIRSYTLRICVYLGSFLKGTNRELRSTVSGVQFLGSVRLSIGSLDFQLTFDQHVMDSRVNNEFKSKTQEKPKK